MTITPTISVIIPSYNDTDTIKKSVLSVLAQSYRDYEIIVVDDGSEEHISNSLKEFTQDNFRVIRHEENQGAAAARNTGILNAHGEYIAFLDSDDTWHSNKLETQYNYMSTLNNSGRIKASCTSFSITHLSKTKSDRILREKNNWQKSLMASCNVSPGSTLMAERSLFSKNEIGLLSTDLRRLEDWDWLISYISKYQLGVIPEILSDIMITGYPKYRTVKGSAKALRRKKSQFVLENFGKSNFKIFRAGLHIECANAAFRGKNYLFLLKHTILAALICPKSAGIFISRLYRKFHGKIQRKLEHIKSPA